LMSNLNNSLSLLPYSEDIVGIKNLKHFIIQSLTLNQYTMPKWNAFGEQSRELKEINKVYCDLYDKYLQTKPMKKKEFTQLEQRNGANYAIFANKELCIFLCMNQLESVVAINHAINHLLKWVKTEEGNYFIKKAT